MPNHRQDAPQSAANGRGRVRVEIHSVTFETNTVTGQWRGLCRTCLWCRVGTQAEVQGLAAVHDLEWVAVETPAPAEAVAS